MHYAFKSRRLYLAIAVLLTLTIGLGIAIVPIEQSLAPQTRFQTLGDGIWWSFTTITAVGYGDYFPVSTPGRTIGVILETIGVTTFGLIIALVTINLFRREQQFYWGRTTERFDRLEEKLDHLQKHQDHSLKEAAPPFPKSPPPSSDHS